MTATSMVRCTLELKREAGGRLFLELHNDINGRRESHNKKELKAKSKIY